MHTFSPGQVLFGFRVLNVEELKEYRSQGVHFLHEASGAQLYRILNNDPENLFSFAFRTPPTNDTGVAHILEHTVLCGSRRFPVKDPFLHMIKGSMQTFLNALTFPDKTVYPAATLNEKDYYNLMEVYADAVFFPLLKPEAFYQEGHHKELDEKGHLFLTGVVYNEMKGDYSSPESLMFGRLTKALFDSGPYAQDSGGDPKHIPELTYEQFVDFHKTYYHPSNCLIHLYGNFDTLKQLEFLDREFLGRFKAQNPVPLIPSHPPRTESRTLTIPFPSVEEEDKGSLILAWHAGDSLDPVLTLSLDLLMEILMGDSGLLQKDLLDSGLGEDISPLSGIETEIRDVLLTIGLRGCDPSKAQEFQALVLKRLEVLATEGLPAPLVDSVLTSFEFNMREIKGGVVGFRLMRASLRAWLHGDKPGAGLALAQPLQMIKEKLAKGPWLEDLIRSHLLENLHRNLYIFTPDSGMIEQQEALIQEQLKAEENQLKQGDRDFLIRQKQEIRHFQEQGDSPEALATLPFLTRQDLPREVTRIISQNTSIAGVPVTIHDGFTNGVAYVDLSFDCSGLTEDEYSWMGLFPKILDGLGLPGMEWHLLAREIQKKAGGLSFQLMVDTPIHEKSLVERFVVRLKMLENSIESALDLLSKILLQANFLCYTRIEELLIEWKNDHYSALIPSGSHFAAYRASSRFSPAVHLNELCRGIQQGEFLSGRNLDVKSLSTLLQRIRDIIITQQDLRINLTGETTFLPRFQSAVETFLQKIPQGQVRPKVAKSTLTPWAPGEILILPTSVNFVSQVIRGSRYGQPGHAPELVLGHWLSSGPLWEEIRMKGGAYGASAGSNGTEGLFTFTTYRDPELVKSLDSYAQILAQASKKALTKKDLETALIGTIGSEMKPRTARENGFIYLHRQLMGISDQLRQERWDALLALEPQQLRQAAEELHSRLKVSTLCAFVGKEAAAQLKKSRPDWSAWVRTPKVGK